MNFIEAVTSCMRKYIDFDGRASRSEIWYFVLFLAVLQFGFVNIPSWAAGNITLKFSVGFGLGAAFPVWQNVFTVLFTLPTLAVFSRRCHDIGHPASKIIVACFVWFTLAIYGKMLIDSVLSPRVFIFALLAAPLGAFAYLTLAGSEKSTNKYGPNPNEAPHER
ncbi:MAG: uncharacterized membrane protein YhaH (DUF805 family) [Yoonia sp.]